jgi:cold shock CspA family protein
MAELWFTLERPGAMNGQLVGRVVTMKFDRGFCFIQSADGARFFAHESALPHGAFQKLNVGDRVTFEEVLPVPAKGRQACRVDVDPIRPDWVAVG